MKRGTLLCLLGGMSAWLGMAGDGCGFDPAGSLQLRKPPAILPSNPQEDSLLRTLEVDLRSYPEADRISWDFGDGTVLVDLSRSAGQRVTHEFTGSGTFLLKVHLFAAADGLLQEPPHLIATGELPIDIVGPNVLPIASFAVRTISDDQTDAVDLMRRFDATRSRDADGTIVDYRWDLGDGTQRTGEIVDHTFARSGRFTVRLVVTDDRGGRSSVVQSVLVNASPTASFTFETGAAGDLSVAFNATGSSDPDGEIRRFSWDFGDDSPLDEGAIVTHTYALPDDYTVTLTVTDEFGGSASTSQVVSVLGTQPFVQSITPDMGEVDALVSGAVIDGGNFENGATVELRLGTDVISGTDVVVQDDRTITATFDLSGAAPGDYDVVVTNPDTSSAALENGFRVVSPNRVRLTTSLGEVVMELVDDAPITTANFLQYVEDDFYDGTIFHRVVPGFVVQGGGFLPGMIPPDGLRDPIMNEFSPDRSNLRGTVAMAKVGNDPDSATSQFFVNLDDNSANLDNQNGGFTVFARVVEGMDVVDQIAGVPLDNNDAPIDDVLLIRAERE